MRAVPALTIVALLSMPCGGGAAESCRTGPCHREVGQDAVQHEPVTQGDCRACHKGSSSGHPEKDGDEFELALGGGADLCYSCHAEIRKEAAGAAAVHGPVKEGRCLDCHLVHGSADRLLLRGLFPEDTVSGLPVRVPFEREAYTLCWKCHDPYAALMERTATLTGFREGSLNLHYLHVNGDKGYTCRACHPVHSSAGPRLLGRRSGWTEDLVNFTSAEGGGSCAPGCHVPRSYRRSSSREGGER